MQYINLFQNLIQNQMQKYLTWAVRCLLNLYTEITLQYGTCINLFRKLFVYYLLKCIWTTAIPITCQF